MKFSLVSDAKCEGKKCYWFEIETWDEQSNHDIVKFLSKEDMSSNDSGYFSLISKHNDDPAYEFDFGTPKDTTQKTTLENQPAEPVEPAPNPDAWMQNDKYEIKSAKESVTVPAGTFECLHITEINKESKEKVDIWYSEKALPLGFVKMQSEDNKMELLELGDGAKSAITETPQKVSVGNILKNAAKQSAEEGAKEGSEDIMEKGIKSIFGR